MVRFAGQMLRRKGYSRNLAFDERVNGEHKDSFRVSLLLRPIEALENYTIYENTDIDKNGNAQIFSDFTSTHPLAGQMADRKSTRLNYSHKCAYRMPSHA